MNGKGLVVACVMASVMALATALVLPAPLRAQTDVAALRDQARARFDVVPLTGGVGLVPKTAIAGVRLIEVRDGAVSINGEAATAKDVRTRLGADADLVLRVTYLDATGLATLTAAPGAPAVAPAPPAPPALPSTPDDRESRRERRRDGQKDGIVRFGGNVTVEKDERVAGEVVVMGGTARILGTVEDELVVIGGTAEVQGTVEGDVSVVGGTLKLGPQSIVEGDVSVAGGSVQREPGSRVDGTVEEVGVGGGRGSVIIGPGDMRRMGGRGMLGSISGTGGLAGLLVRIVLLLIGVLAVVALGGQYARPMAARAGAEPLRSGGLGLLAEVLFVPVLVLTVVVLAVSIIGIPLLLLLPFALVLVMLVALVGFAGVSLRLGELVLSRMGRVGDSLYLQAVAGVLVVMALPLAGRLVAVAGVGFVGVPVAIVGFLVEYVAWTVGLGAAIWVLRRSRGRVPAPVNPTGVPPVDVPPAGMGPEAMA